LKLAARGDMPSVDNDQRQPKSYYILSIIIVIIIIIDKVDRVYVVAIDADHGQEQFASYRAQQAKVTIIG